MSDGANASKSKAAYSRAAAPTMVIASKGLAAGPAIQKRWGKSLSDLPDGHIAHTLIADYVGQARATLALTLSIGRIVIGGGVSNAPGLHSAVEDRAFHWLAGYLPEHQAKSGRFIAAPALGDGAGLIGAMVLAEKAVSA